MRVHGDMASSFKDADGNLVEYFKGDVVADEHVELLDSWGALVRPGDEDLSIEERMERELGIEREDTTPRPEPAAVPAVPDIVRITGGYESSDYKVDGLQAEIEMRRSEGREIPVEGTGSGGNVLRADLEKALTADDQARVTT